jgi:hypothetical protein
LQKVKKLRRRHAIDIRRLLWQSSKRFDPRASGTTFKPSAILGATEAAMSFQYVFLGLIKYMYLSVSVSFGGLSS